MSEPKTWETAGPPPRELVRAAWIAMADRLSSAQPGERPGPRYLAGAVATLEWALGMQRVAPLSGKPTLGEVPTAAEAAAEAEYAYERMRQVNPDAGEFRFITAVEHTTMWLSTGRGINLR